MHKTTGFTLIELLIVVAIIGILAAIAVPNFLGAQIRAKVAHSKAELRTYIQIQNLYFMDHNDIPGHYDGREEHCPYIILNYISGPLTDPFTIDDPEVHLTSHQGMYHSTHLRSPGDVARINPRLHEEWIRNKRGYIIFGEGPGIPSWDDYDVSNGLMSNGRIVKASIRGKGIPGGNLPGRECNQSQ